MESKTNNLIETFYETFDVGSHPYGISYGAWTVKWWRWALGTPKSDNPVVDNTGEKWQNGQTHKDVWFLAGKFGSQDKNVPTRTVKMPQGRSILIPILNCEANPLEYPHLDSNDKLINHVKSDIETVVKKDCFIKIVGNDESHRLNPARVQSDPEIFEVKIVDYRDNPKTSMGEGVTNAAAEGFWIFLKPLPVGEYEITFKGSCENGNLYAGATYLLKIENN